MILSASWGTDDAVGCPGGEQGLDNIPVTFDRFIQKSSIQTTDFEVVRSDGSTVTPTCALQFPPDEANEAQTVNLIGDFGDSVNGPLPATVRVVGQLLGKAPGSMLWRPIPRVADADVDGLEGGPYIVDVWTLTPSLSAGDPNGCTLGSTFVRVMWSNGLTAAGTGAEVGEAVLAGYRAQYELPDAATIELAPVEIADLDDHPNVANADNMHDLCVGQPPTGAELIGVTIDAGLIQDPNGDANDAQRFRTERPESPWAWSRLWGTTG